MIISLLQEKGGSGKTTIAVNVAKAFKDYGFSVLLVDGDPQGSARDWHANNDGSVLNLVALDRPTIDKDIQRFKRNYDYVFIDAPARLTTMAARIICCSDVILIPVQPSPYDVWATKALVDLIKQRQIISNGQPKAAFVISRQVPQTIIGKEIRSVIEEYGLPALEHGTFQRIIYPMASASGKTVIGSKDTLAEKEILLLAGEILEFCNDNAKS